MPSPGLLPKVQEAPPEGIHTLSADSSCSCPVIISDNFTFQVATDKPNFKSAQTYLIASLPIPGLLFLQLHILWNEKHNDCPSTPGSGVSHSSAVLLSSRGRQGSRWNKGQMLELEPPAWLPGPVSSP